MLTCFLHLLTGVTLLLPFKALSQQDEQIRVEEFRMQQQQIERAAIMRQMDSAIYFMEAGNYSLADEKFRIVLDRLKSVPSDFTFHFGKNSFHLGKYRQSIDWLNKYIALRGTSGRFYEEAVHWMERAQTEYQSLRQKDSEQAHEILSRNYTIDCGPSGKVICPVCKGSTVIIKKGPFNNEYTTCHYCDSHGTMTCEDYNLLLRGELQR